MSKLLVLALAACLLGSVAAAQTAVDLSVGEARTLALQALLSGDSATALTIARAILAQAPDDRDALAIVAAAAPQLGDPRAGRIAGARAFALSQTDAQRYEAARLTALAAANEQRFTLGTFWLRRALIAAQTEAERTQTRADARLLQQQNPWAFGVAATVLPSSNVNGGASDNKVPDLFGLTGTLSDAALKQPGLRNSFDISASYRLQESPASRTIIGAQYQLNRVTLTNDVDLPRNAFATNTAELSLRHDQALTTGSVTGRLSVGRFVYRQLINNETQSENRFSDSIRLGVDRRLPLGSSAELTLSFDRGLTNYDDDAVGQVRRSSFGASVVQILPSGDTVLSAISYAKSDATNPSYRATDWTIRGGYFWADPIGPVDVSVTGGVTWSDYPDYGLFAGPDGRQDTSVFTTLNLGFAQVSYAGFTPSLTITGTATDSNVSRFTRDAIFAGVSIRSDF